MKKALFVLVFLFVAQAAIHSYAVILSGGDGSGNTNAPADDPGWSNVGRIDTAPSSATYLGDSWFITAHHVHILDDPAKVYLDSGTYNIDSWTRITNSTGTGADLELFKVTSNPSENDLTIRGLSISQNADVVMIGNGRDRQESETYWNVDTSGATWQWTETSPPLSYNASGYKYASSGSSRRWGENSVDSTNIDVDTGYGTSTCFRTQFDDILNDAQGATYDSGGGVFIKKGANWELAGIMITVGTYNNQPSGTAVYGNKTYIADLTQYKDQINNTVPEPTMAILIAFAFFSSLFLYRLKRRLW